MVRTKEKKTLTVDWDPEGFGTQFHRGEFDEKVDDGNVSGSGKWGGRKRNSFARSEAFDRDCTGQGFAWNGVSI